VSAPQSFHDAIRRYKDRSQLDAPQQPPAIAAVVTAQEEACIALSAEPSSCANPDL
jgi:hypothetical protein